MLYRNNAQSVFIENELKLLGIEYDIVNDGSFFKKREISAIISFLRLVNDPDDDGALETIFRFRTYPLKFFSNKLFDDIRASSVNKGVSLYEALVTYRYEKPFQERSTSEFHRNIGRLISQKERGVSVKTLISNIIDYFSIKDYINDKYNSKEEIDDRIKSLDVLQTFVKNNNLEQFITYVYGNNAKKKDRKNAVKMMTIHASKGLEWDNVFLVGVEDSVFPHERSDIHEEARLMYVATTRPKNNLYVSQIGRGNRFIREYFKE